MIIFGIILTILLFLITFFSSVYFLVIKKVKIKEWLFFNSCSPSNLIYCLGFCFLLLTKINFLIYFGIFPMFFFGTLGLFIFPWKEKKDLFVQLSHILMTSSIIWTITYTFREKIFESATVGLFSGGFIFLIFLFFQQDYVKKHFNDFKKILDLD
jgi:hypothetical protein